VCTVKNSWWWTEELSETCRVSFQNKHFWEISASIWFYCKRCITMHGHTNVKFVHLLLYHMIHEYMWILGFWRFPDNPINTEGLNVSLTAI
jgi:hypothetical protein